MSYYDEVLLYIRQHFMKHDHHYKSSTKESKEVVDRSQGEKKDE